MSITEIERMSATERLQTMEALWDAMCHEAKEPESPGWHRDVLAERRRRIESGEAKFYTLQEAREKLLK